MKRPLFNNNIEENKLKICRETIDIVLTNLEHFIEFFDLDGIIPLKNDWMQWSVLDFRGLYFESESLQSSRKSIGNESLLIPFSCIKDIQCPNIRQIFSYVNFRI